MRDTAVIYCRVSTDKQEDNYSLPSQEALCREYCAAQGYAVLDVYKEVESGDDIDRRQMDAAIATLRAGRAEVFVTLDMDRMTRHGVNHYGWVATECEMAGGRVELVQETEMERGEYGGVFRAIKAKYAQDERKKIRERTQRGIRGRIESGKLPAAPWPRYGYLFADDTHAAYIVDPDTAWVVKRVFADVASGKTLGSVARQLTAERVPTPSQILQARGQYSRPATAAWSVPALKQMIDDTRYKGELDAFRHQVKKGRRKDKQTGEWHKVTSAPLRALDDATRVRLPASVCPPLVDDETWASAQAVKRNNQNSTARNDFEKDKPLLSAGFVRCGYCGGKLHSRMQKGDRYYYCWRASRPGQVCPGGKRYLVYADKLDREVWNSYVVPLLRHPEAMQQAVQRRQDSNSTRDDALESRHAAMAKTLQDRRGQRDTLVTNMGMVTAQAAVAALAHRLEVVSDEVDQLEKDLAALEADMSESRENSRQWDAVARNVDKWRQDVDSLSYEEKRAVLYALGICVLTYRSADDQQKLAGVMPQRALELAPDTSSRYRVLYFTEWAVQAAGVPVMAGEYGQAALEGMAAWVSEAMAGQDVNKRKPLFSSWPYPVLSWADVAGLIPA